MNKSQQVMADLLEVKQRTYAHYELKPEGNIPVAILQKLAKMGLNLHWLFTGIGSMLNSERAEEPVGGVSPEHFAEAYVLVKAGLGKHALPSVTEGLMISHVAEGLSQGVSQELVLKAFEEEVERVRAERNRRHLKG